MKPQLTLKATLLAFLISLNTHANAGLWDDPQNLQALPENITPEQLRETMRSFATDTGSRCSTCHVYEDEVDLGTYEFPADDKEKKRKAREMIRMVAEINAFIEANIGEATANRVRVECSTCHRGVEKPEMLHDIIERAYLAEGMEAAIAEYRDLRARYYGSYAYDFSPTELMIVAESLARQDERQAAIRFLDLNLELNPDHANSYVLRARILADSGDKTGARKSLLKAIELEPDNPWNRQLLEKLDESGE